MTFTADKSLPVDSKLWVDSITGVAASPSNGRQAVKILAQEFLCIESNFCPYIELVLLLEPSQIDELISTLKNLRSADK